MTTFGVEEDSDGEHLTKDDTRISDEIVEDLSDGVYDSDHDESKKERAAYAYFRETVDRSKQGGLQG